MTIEKKLGIGRLKAIIGRKVVRGGRDCPHLDWGYDESGEAYCHDCKKVVPISSVPKRDADEAMLAALAALHSKQGIESKLTPRFKLIGKDAAKHHPDGTPCTKSDSWSIRCGSHDKLLSMTSDGVPIGSKTAERIHTLEVELQRLADEGLSLVDAEEDWKALKLRAERAEQLLHEMTGNWQLCERDLKAAEVRVAELFMLVRGHPDCLKCTDYVTAHEREE